MQDLDIIEELNKILLADKQTSDSQMPFDLKTWKRMKMFEINVIALKKQIETAFNKAELKSQIDIEELLNEQT